MTIQTRFFSGRWPKSPSPVLQLLLIAVILALATFVWSESQGNVFGFKTRQFNLEKGQWIVLLGVAAAMCGWLISSMVAIRNSIRQHTVTILLQSRLSQTYVDRASRVYERYFHPYGMRYLTEEEVRSNAPEAELVALRYVLSYLEFIAIGIRYGDLDEKLMRRTLRDLVCSLYEAAGATLAKGPRRISDGEAADRRGMPAITTLESLTWLYGYWYDEKLQRPRVTFLRAEATQEPAAEDPQPVEIIRTRAGPSRAAHH